MIAAQPRDHPGEGRPARVAVAAPSRLFRESLAAALEALGKLEVATSGGDEPDEGFSSDELAADVLLLCCDRVDETLLTRLRTLRAAASELRVLVLVAEATSSALVSLAEVGVAGCVLRGQSLVELHQALLAAARGESVFPQQLAGSLFHRLSALGREQRRRERLDSLSLTARELEVLQLLADGRNNREIADQLCLSIHTVKNHIHRVLEMLGARSRWEAAKMAVAKGWVPDRRAAAQREDWNGQSA